MTRQVRPSRSIPAAILLVATLGACARVPEAPVDTQSSAEAAATHGAHALSARAADQLTADQLRTIAAVRQATARFHDIEAAKAAGYTQQYPAGCASSPAGAQGFHFLNPALAADDVVDPLRPELLMYEPKRGGGMQLVGVDYVIPYAKRPATATPPTLLDQPLAKLDALQVWAIHIWAWRPNPEGMFAPWNPKVSCADATS